MIEHLPFPDERRVMRIARMAEPVLDQPELLPAELIAIAKEHVAYINAKVEEFDGIVLDAQTYNIQYMDMQAANQGVVDDLMNAVFKRIRF